MPLLALPAVTPYPSPIIVGDPVSLNNLRRNRFIRQARALTHNALYVLTFASWGLTVVYQVQLVELQLKARNWIGLILPIFTPMSDPRIACLHEASAPVLFAAWISLSLEWYVAYSNVPVDEELRYVPRVGCVEGSSSCTILFWYLICTFSISLCFFAEFVVILTIHHGPQFRKAIKSLCARLREAIARKIITNNTPTTAVAVPVQNDVELEQQYESGNQSTVHTIAPSGTSTPNAPGLYDLNTANLTWLTMVYAQESEDHIIPYYVYGQGGLPSAVATAAPSIEIDTAALTPRTASPALSVAFESADVAVATVAVSFTVGASAAAEESLQVLSTVPSVTQVSTCYALDFGLRAQALFYEQMGFDTLKLNKAGPSSTTVAASPMSSEFLNRRTTAEVDAVEDAAAAVVIQASVEYDYDADISDTESFSVSEDEETDGATDAGEQVVPVEESIGVAAAAAEGESDGSEEEREITDRTHPDYNYARFQRQPNAWSQQYGTDMRARMSWLAQWDTRPRGNVVQRRHSGDDDCLEAISYPSVEVEMSGSASPSFSSPLPSSPLAL
ncbi:MAG: hypothetical protein J3R72DRAFT_415898 [Linnemannia gamsii]|nr:MAG: hypothetical protein J3R72DRAFT_415898 [Linnemannia gamsii]